MKFTNSTNSELSSTYVFAPIDYTLKIGIACAYAISASYTLVANSLILYFTRTKPSPSNQTAYSRSRLVDIYIQSLALTDILSAVISFPIFAAEMFIDFIHNDTICKFIRCFISIPPIATMVNYTVIGLDRYVAVFYPLTLPRVKIGKRIVVVAWIVAGAIVCLGILVFNIMKFDLGNNTYTLVCKYDNSTFTSRTAFISVTLIAWFIPCSVLTILNIKILKHLRRRRRAIEERQAISNIKARANFRNERITKLFVTLIFAFITPYMSFMLYGAVNIIAKPKVNIKQDYIARYITTFLNYTNGAIGATILFFNSAYHRRRLIELVRSVSSQAANPND